MKKPQENSENEAIQWRADVASSAMEEEAMLPPNRLLEFVERQGDRI